MFLSSFPRGCTSSNFTSAAAAVVVWRPVFAFSHPPPPSNINISVSAGVNVDYKRKRAAALGDEGMKECARAEKEHTLIERPPGVAANICRKMRISPGAACAGDAREEEEEEEELVWSQRSALNSSSSCVGSPASCASAHDYFICVNGQFFPRLRSECPAAAVAHKRNTKEVRRAGSEEQLRKCSRVSDFFFS